MPRTINSPSLSQKITHKLFSSCVNAWKKHSWTAAEILLWVQYSKRHPKFNAVGDQYFMTAQLTFYKFNLYRLRNDLPIIYLPPAD